MVLERVRVRGLAVGNTFAASRVWTEMKCPADHKRRMARTPGRGTCLQSEPPGNARIDALAHSRHRRCAARSGGRV